MWPNLVNVNLEAGNLAQIRRARKVKHEDIVVGRTAVVPAKAP